VSRILGIALLLGVTVGWVGEAGAHALDPALLDIRESVDGHAEVTWKTPALRVPGTSMRPLLPPRCRELTPPVASEEATSITARWTVDCGPGGLVGQRLGVEGLGSSKTDALVRIVLADGRVVQRVVRPREPFLTVPERPRALDVFHDYLAFGVEHILGGPDHLLFVFGLLLLVPTRRLLVQTVTAFTAGHSVTLSIAVLGIANVPPRPAELAIALTVLVLAMELARAAPSPTLMRRFPWVMALVFGLIHGLGFAGALREVGLPAGEIPMALFSFNVGIEVGQLMFVWVGWGFGRLRWRRPAWTVWVPVYTMGSLAAFWCFERAAALLR
jgi:hydrogenase/urease accessory protein HupE